MLDQQLLYIAAQIAVDVRGSRRSFVTGRFRRLDGAAVVVSPVRHRVGNCWAKVGGRVKVVESAGLIRAIAGSTVSGGDVRGVSSGGYGSGLPN